MHILVHLSNAVISSAVASIIRDGVTVPHSVRTIADDGPSRKVDVAVVDAHTIADKALKPYASAKIVLMDSGRDQQDIVRLMACHRVSGVISAIADVPLFIKALEAVYRGELWIGHDTVKALLENNEMITPVDSIRPLSPRERQIIDYICKGHTNREIADKLTLSEQTIKAHLNRIFRKFNVTSRSKLIAAAIRG